LFYKKAHKQYLELQFLQEAVHQDINQNDAVMRQKIDYIHHNPVKRGYVDEAEHWRYSSARNHLGREGLIDVCTDW
jgi:putative transposase